MNMADKRAFVREIENMSDEEIHKRVALIKEKFKGVFDELAKH